MKRGNKKGQFYLLAAIVIIVLIVGFAAISNYAKKKSSIKLYDIKDELQIEGGEVLEYGVYTGDPQIEDFIEKYQEYAGEGKNLYFIFGSMDSVWLVKFEEVLTGTVKLSSGETVPVYEKKNETISLGAAEGGKVIVTIGRIDYEFELKPGENFFFVLSQEIEGEQHIVTG